MLCAGPGIYIVVYMGIFLLHRFPVPAQYTLGFVQTFLKDFFCFAFLLVRHAAGAVFGMPESVGVSAVRLILPDVFVLLAADALVVIPDMLMLGVERTAFRTVVALVKLLTYMHGRCIGVRFAAPAAYAVFVFVLAGLGGITSVCRTAGSSCSADAGAVCVAVAGLDRVRTFGGCAKGIVTVGICFIHYRAAATACFSGICCQCRSWQRTQAHHKGKEQCKSAFANGFRNNHKILPFFA